MTREQQVTLPDLQEKSDKRNFSAQENMRSALKKGRIETRESADGRTKFGRQKVDLKVRQIAIGAARLRTSTVMTLPSNAKELLERSQASDQRATLTSSATRASAAVRQ